jgi:hypothetical protein
VLHEQRAEYGEQIVATLSRQLTDEFGRGWNKAALTRMMQFAERFSDPKIVATLSQQLTWSHVVELLPLKDSLQRDFYAEIGLILCSAKPQERIELMELGKSSIRVAEYLTVLPPRYLLAKKLHEAIRQAQARMLPESPPPPQTA